MDNGSVKIKWLRNTCGSEHLVGAVLNDSACCH